MANEAQIYKTSPIANVDSGASISDGAFSLTSDIDNAVENGALTYPYAIVTLILNDLSAAPSAGRTVDLYRRGIDVFGGLNEPEPDTNYKGTYVGAFLIDAVDPAGTDTPYTLLSIPLLPGTQNFYIQNNLGVTISAWHLIVTPYTFRPAPP